MDILKDVLKSSSFISKSLGEKLFKEGRTKMLEVRQLMELNIFMD